MATIVSDTAGRLRVRLRRSRRHPQDMATIRDRVCARSGIDGVDINPTTGSVTVSYDHTRRTRDDVVAMLKDVGVVFGEISGAGDTLSGVLSAGKEGGGRSTTAQGIVGAVDDLDRRLSALTGRTLDLKLLFPAALGAFGLIKIARDGLQFGDIPGYVLLWYAFDSFYKLHVEPTRPPDAVDGAVNSPLRARRADRLPS